MDLKLEGELRGFPEVEGGVTFFCGESSKESSMMFSRRAVLAEV